MFKTSEQLLKIAVEKYKKTNNSEVELEYKEYSGIVGIDGNIEDVLDDLIRNILNLTKTVVSQLCSKTHITTVIYRKSWEIIILSFKTINKMILSS